jgi:hypothetical protein
MVKVEVLYIVTMGDSVRIRSQRNPLQERLLLHR